MSTRKTKPSQPKVDLDLTRDRLLRLGLQHAADALAEQVTAAVKDTVSPHRFLDQLLEAELTNREERRIRTSLRLSGLPTGQTLGNFDFAFQPSIERSRIETLGTCAWIRERYTLLIQGPPGVGKTHLAIALGVQAIENGFSVAFFRLEELLAALKRDADLPPNRLRRRKYNNVALTVIDEVGFEPMSRQEASLFFRLVSYRYGPRQHPDHHQQRHPRLARDPRRRRGPRHRHPRPPAAPIPRPRHQGPQLPAPRPRARRGRRIVSIFRDRVVGYGRCRVCRSRGRLDAALGKLASGHLPTTLPPDLGNRCRDSHSHLENAPRFPHLPQPRRRRPTSTRSSRGPPGRRAEPEILVGTTVS